MLAAWGCGPKQADPAAVHEVTKTPIGVWYGQGVSGQQLELTVEDGGTVTWVEGGRRSSGTWNQPGEGKVEFLLDSGPFKADFVRKPMALDLTFDGGRTITLSVQ